MYFGCLIAQILGRWFLTYWFFSVGLIYCISIYLMHNDVSRLECLWGLLVSLVISRENFDNGHFELFNLLINFPGLWLIRPAFLTDIKPCDVIIHKVNWAVWCPHWNTPLYTNEKLSDFFSIMLTISFLLYCFAVLTECNLNHLYNEWCHLKLTY